MNYEKVRKFFPKLTDQERTTLLNSAKSRNDFEEFYALKKSSSKFLLEAGQPETIFTLLPKIYQRNQISLGLSLRVNDDCEGEKYQNVCDYFLSLEEAWKIIKDEFDVDSDQFTYKAPGQKFIGYVCLDAMKDYKGELNHVNDFVEDFHNIIKNYPSEEYNCKLLETKWEW